jgi:hypothetical protein
MDVVVNVDGNGVHAHVYDRAGFLAMGTTSTYLGLCMAKKAEFRVAECAEFPNDNQSLHRGGVFSGVESGEHVVFEPYFEEADDGGPAIEVVSELVFEDAIEESTLGGDLEEDLPPDTEAPVPAEVDAFTGFVEALTKVAMSLGGDPQAVHRLRSLLGQTRMDGVTTDARAIGWRGILLGESEDYSSCGSQTLDEWAAGLVVECVPGAGRPDGVKRELRKHGVAAFGFVANAA